MLSTLILAGFDFLLSSKQDKSGTVSFNELDRVLSKHAGGSAGGVGAWKHGQVGEVADGGSAGLATLLKSLKNMVRGGE